VLEQEGRAALADHAGADLGHLQAGVHLGLDPVELALALQVGEEGPEVGKGHGPVRA
jgi:hypothetical protein